MRLTICLIVLFAFGGLSAQQLSISDSLTINSTDREELKEIFKFQLYKDGPKIVSERTWFNSSITSLSAITDQVRLVDMTILCPTIYNTDVWGEYYYLDIRRLSLEIEKREDNRDW